MKNKTYNVPIITIIVMDNNVILESNFGTTPDMKWEEMDSSPWEVSGNE